MLWLGAGLGIGVVLAVESAHPTNPLSVTYPALDQMFKPWFLAKLSSDWYCER